MSVKRSEKRVTMVSTRVSENFASVYISRGICSRSEPSRSSSIHSSSRNCILVRVLLRWNHPKKPLYRRPLGRSVGPRTTGIEVPL